MPSARAGMRRPGYVTLLKPFLCATLQHLTQRPRRVPPRLEAQVHGLEPRGTAGIRAPASASSWKARDLGSFEISGGRRATKKTCQYYRRRAGQAWFSSSNTRGASRRCRHRDLLHRLHLLLPLLSTAFVEGIHIVASGVAPLVNQAERRSSSCKSPLRYCPLN